MININRALDNLDTRVEDLLAHDVTIIAIRIVENRESREARVLVHCRMDERFMTWASEYYHRRVGYTKRYDKEFIPFLDGEVFALIALEDR